MKECQQCKRCYSDEVSTCPDDGQATFHSISGEPLLENKYKLEKRLGQGGMGVVYSARHAYLKTQHAIKIILPDLVGNDPQLVTRFRQEALAAAAIRHHNVVFVSDYGVAFGTMPFLVMEFVEGESLHDLLAREKRLPPDRAFELMAAIAAGVGAAHRQGIVHRDLKPLNIMICRGKDSMAEAVKILDFGLAKIKSGELLGSFIQAQTTGLMGSPYYMAPEQWADEEPDAASDIYSLGVMLFQMLAGDVPFKGSSIPAIMKKHLQDAPPSFAEMGVSVSPQVELAVRHTLEKNRANRTRTVEQLTEELRSAVGYVSQSIHTTGIPLAVSTVHILTRPPQASIFVDNVAVGQSKPDGWLLLEGLQSGSHHLRISREGYQDWVNSILCDGKPQQVVADLAAAQPQTEPIPHPGLGTGQFSQPSMSNSVSHFGPTQGAAAAGMNQTAQPWQTGMQTGVPAVAKKSLVSPILLAITGILGLLLLLGVGVGGAYFAGFIGKQNTGPDVNSNTGNQSQTNSNPITAPPVKVKNEMVEIPGGKFTMGRNDGPPGEQPEHPVEVKDFLMDKTEVTNAEYHDFTMETGYRAPLDWANSRPVAGEEMFPVSRVSIEDVNKFIEWRSKRDGVTYRLPTEEEWEYAARNGSSENLYPWGDKLDPGHAVIERSAAQPVGSLPAGANKWGVLDLIGNVWEWTSSNIKPYPKSPAVFSKPNNIVIRGGSYNTKAAGDKTVSSTTRYDADPTKQDGLLGFRLVRSK
jgi:eukaryotic-like serine/threonine-protein kinase